MLSERSGVGLQGAARIRGEESAGTPPVSQFSIFSLHVSSLQLIDENILLLLLLSCFSRVPLCATP